MNRRNFLLNFLLWILFFIFGYRVGNFHIKSGVLSEEWAETVQQNKNKKIVSLLDFEGINYDGVADDTVAFQDVIRSLETPITLFIPKLDTPLRIDIGNIYLVGDLEIISNGANIVTSSDGKAKNIFVMDGISNVSINGLNFYADSRQSSDVIIALHVMNGSRNIKIRDCEADTVSYLVKVDSNDFLTTPNENMTMQNLKTKNVLMPIYLSAIKHVAVRDTVFDRTGDTNGLNHHFYINSNSFNVTIDNALLKGGAGFAIDVKNDKNTQDAAPSVTIINTTFEDADSCIVSEQMAKVRASNLKIKIPDTPTTNSKVFGVYSANLNVENFEVTGTSQKLLTMTGSVSDCTLTNGEVEGYKTVLVDTGTTNSGKLKVKNVEFMDAVSKSEGIVFWTGTNSYVFEKVVFSDCKFNFLTQQKDEPFSLRNGRIEFNNCDFYAETPSNMFNLFYTYTGATSVFMNCKFEGTFNNVSWTSSAVTSHFINCFNKNTNTKYELNVS